MDEPIVIGAGMQGMTVALALAERGVRTLVLEAAERPLLGASLRNEGKIHLGFVYALDRSGETARVMAKGALSFTPLMERWCGDLDWAGNRSDRFAYVVMNGGLSTPAELEAHYENVMTEVDRAAEEFGSRYLGDDGLSVVRQGSGPAPGLRPGLSNGWFETPERSVDPRMLCAVLARAVTDDPLIEVRTGHRVTGVTRGESGFKLSLEGSSAPPAIEATQVINCSWESRHSLDAEALGGSPRANYRVKHRILVRGSGEHTLVPVTMVQGAYGDLVPWPCGDVFVSWYPTARTYFGDVPATEMEPDPEVANRTLDELKKLVPGLDGFKVVDHGPCHIVAEAHTDIEDPASGLHSRVPRMAEGNLGWWSLSGGKLTTAPLASERCAALITGDDARI